MKWFVILGILAFLLGVASPTPIWPGPLLVRHLPPAILSAVLMIVACLGARKDGSRVLGVLSLIYGCLASLAGVFFLFLTRASIFIITIGSVVAIVLGIVVIFLGWKTFKLKKQS